MQPTTATSARGARPFPLRRTVTIEPNVPGLVRWLQHVYRTDPATATRIIRTAWPCLSAYNAQSVLLGRVTLHDAVSIAAADMDGNHDTV